MNTDVDADLHTCKHTHIHIQSHKSNCLRCVICTCFIPLHVWKHCNMLAMYIMCSQDPYHLNIHLNADVELQVSSHTDNTFGWLFQLGLSDALLLFCTDSSFHWVRRDKAASSFLYYTHLKPLSCEKSFNAVPLRGEKNSLKKVHSLADSFKFTFHFHCEWPLKKQCFPINKYKLCYFL